MSPSINYCIQSRAAAAAAAAADADDDDPRSIERAVCVLNKNVDDFFFENKSNLERSSSLLAAFLVKAFIYLSERIFIDRSRHFPTNHKRGEIKRKCSIKTFLSSKSSCCCWRRCFCAHLIDLYQNEVRPYALHKINCSTSIHQYSLLFLKVFTTIFRQSAAQSGSISADFSPDYLKGCFPKPCFYLCLFVTRKKTEIVVVLFFIVFREMMQYFHAIVELS